LHPGRLGQAQVQCFLKVLVHHVNHPVAESPKGKQQDEEEEGEDDVLAVISDEHTLFNGLRLLGNVRAVISNEPAFVIDFHFLGGGWDF
jgi:hypothetical protein